MKVHGRPSACCCSTTAARFRLDVDYVIGREPQHDPDVLAGAVRPLRIADTEGVVSRRHARVALIGWDVHVVDLGSANGTFVQLPGTLSATNWSPTSPPSSRPAPWSRGAALVPLRVTPKPVSERVSPVMQSIADYEFIRPLGSGNHGQFFLARRPARLPVDVEFVAVKVLSGESTTDTFRRATREMKAFAVGPFAVSGDSVRRGPARRHLLLLDGVPADGSLAEPARPVDLTRRCGLSRTARGRPARCTPPASSTVTSSRATSC